MLEFSMAWESGQSEAAPNPISTVTAIVAIAATVAIAPTVALQHGATIGTSSPNRYCCAIVAVLQ